MNISYEEIGQVVVTCPAREGVSEGAMVKMDADGAVADCVAGNRFCGLCLAVAGDGCAAVQMGGFVSVSCADAAVTPGWVALTADGTGGVKKAGDGDQGETMLVMAADGEKAVVRL